MKVKNIEVVSKMILSDLNDFNKLQDSITILKQELQKNENDCFTYWCSNTLRSISNSNLRYKNLNSILFICSVKISLLVTV